MNLRLLAILLRLGKVCDVPRDRYQWVVREFLGIKDNSNYQQMFRGAPEIKFDKKNKEIILEVFISDIKHKELAMTEEEIKIVDEVI